MDIVCQKLDQQTEELRQRILNEEKVKECLKSFQKRISKIHDTAHMNSMKIDNRRMKVLILQNAIKFVKYECEKLKQNPALFSSEFGSIIYNEIMEFSERTITHLRSDLQKHIMRRCGYDNNHHSETLSIASAPSVVSISLHDDSEDDHHHHNDHHHSPFNPMSNMNDNMIVMVHNDDDRYNNDNENDESIRNKALDQISPPITEKDLQKLDEVVISKEDDDDGDEKTLSYRDQKEMDMVFIPTSLQNEFEEKFAKMTMSKKKELAKKVKIDDNVVSTEDLLKFYYMEKYGTAKKRAKDEKLYEDEHFQSWYNDTAKGKAHEFVNDKLKLKYDLYTFYMNKYGKSKLRKDEKDQFVYFSRSFQSWYKKKLLKKTSVVKKWLNDQKEKLSASTNSSSEEDYNDSNSGVKKGGSVEGAVMGPQLPVACHNMFNHLQKPLEGISQQQTPECTLDSITPEDLQSIINDIDDNTLSQYVSSLQDHEVDILEKKLSQIKYEEFELIDLSEKDIQEVALNDLYSSMNFFVPDNTEIHEKEPVMGKGGGAASTSTLTYNRVRLHSDIKHDFHESIKDESFNNLSSAKTEDAFIHYALKDKIQDIYQKTYYANMRNIKGNGFMKTPIPSLYEYAVMDMRMGEGITVSPQKQSERINTLGGINEIITYGNLMDATMRQNDKPSTDWYDQITNDEITINLESIINTFFQAEFPKFEATNLTYNSSTKMFTIFINDESFTFNGKNFEKNIVEKNLEPLASILSNILLLGDSNRKVLFKRMFKSLGDHIQLHELVKMRGNNQNSDNLQKTIFATSDRILVADAIRNDIDVMFDLSDTFFNALKDPFGHSIDLSSVKKIPPFSEEDARQRKETYFIIYTNKILRSDMTSFSKMFHSKLKLYINVTRKLQLFVNIDEKTPYIKNISDHISSFHDNYPEVTDASSNNINQINALKDSIINLLNIFYNTSEFSGKLYTQVDINNKLIAHKNLYHVLYFFDIVFAIIEKGIYSFERMQMSNMDITLKTSKIIRLINQYTEPSLRDPSPRSKDYKSLEDLYDELNNIFYWAFIDVSNDIDRFNMVHKLIETLTNKYSEVFNDSEDGVSTYNNIRLNNTIISIISTIFNEIFNNDAFKPISEDIDSQSKYHFTNIHNTLMNAGDKIGKSYNILPLDTALSLPFRKRLTKNNKRLAGSFDVEKVNSFIKEVRGKRGKRGK